MATGQTILNLMEVLHPELQLQSGEVDVTKGLLVLNAAQDYMESIFALQPDLLGDSKGTVATVASTETTAFPTGVLRLDGVQYLDTNSYPVYELQDIRATGGHIATSSIPAFITSTSTLTGAPNAYWTDGSYFYWNPLPDGVYTLRWYGFQSKSDITASGTFGYPDVCLLPLATFAVRIERMGLDDDTSQYIKLATDLFEPVVSLLGNFQRERAPGFQYRHMHLT